MTKYLSIALGLFVLAVIPSSCRRETVNVASKKFTESVILGEIVAQAFSSAGVATKHYRELGGTRVAYNALLSGEIDIYPEYTGTIREELFAGESLKSLTAMRQRLADVGVSLSQPLGFNNTYALAMRRDRAAALGIETVSDLGRHPDLRFALTNEILERADGWPALTRHYGFRFPNVTGMDHDLAYRQVQSGAVDVIDVYSTDAKIDALDLVTLEDDRTFFPRYEAVLLYRTQLLERFPRLEAVIDKLAGRLTAAEMIGLNGRVEIDGESEAAVAAAFLRSALDIRSEVETDSTSAQITRRSLEHLDLVRRSLLPAILLGVPLGVLAFRWRRGRGVILGTVGVIQTIPALALLVMLMPLVAWLGGRSVGTGSLTAVVALFLYSLLPIVRGTFTGLAGIAPSYFESADAMGLPPSFQLWNIELPLALRNILAGVKTAAVMNIGFATLGALIGAGGYGQPILTGIRLADTGLILQGAIPAAVLALAVQWLFDLIENRSVRH